MSIELEPRVDQAKRRRLRPSGERPAEQPPATPGPPPVPGRRNPRWIALGVVALCLGALLSYAVYSRVADESTVVAVTRTVHRGDTIAAADLTVARVGAVSGVQTVPATQLEELVGQKAVYDLVSGSLLPVGAVADVLVPGTGRTIVGIRVVAGRAPSGLIPAGSPLRLVALPPPSAEPGFKDQYTGRTFLCRQISQAEGVDGASVVLNVDVPADQAPAVALLAAQERVAVVRDADR